MGYRNRILEGAKLLFPAREDNSVHLLIGLLSTCTHIQHSERGEWKPLMSLWLDDFKCAKALLKVETY
jgi:hypothetical protein